MTPGDGNDHAPR